MDDFVKLDTAAPTQYLESGLIWSEDQESAVWMPHFAAADEISLQSGDVWGCRSFAPGMRIVRPARRLPPPPEVVVPKSVGCPDPGGYSQSVVASLFMLLVVSPVDARQEAVDDKIGH
jgi:hypothetical protein